MSSSIPIRIFTLVLLIGLSVDLAKALQCYKCNSTSTPDCAINPSDQLETVECPAEDGECAMAVLDDMATYRGCLSDIVIPENCRTCQNATCTDDLCNGGIYPESRPKCYKCERQECVNVSGPAEPCLNYDTDDLCYVDVIDETDVIRGCVSDDDYNAGVYTDFCRGDGCNNIAAASPFSCISCDSDNDENCKHGDTSAWVCRVNVTDVCTVNVLHGRSESCFTYHNGEKVVRGCSRLSPDLVMQSQYISVCRTSDCNDDCIITPTCYVCDSNQDQNCLMDQGSLTPQDCPQETLSCYTCKHEDQSITRGCGGNGTFSGNTTCLSCWDENGCNSNLIQTCYHCNSGTDNNCATWQNTSALDIAVCTGKCVVKVNDLSFTVRGCQTGSLRCAPGDSLCKECDGDNCNGGVFPEERQLCYQCDSSNENCDSDQSNSPPPACSQYMSSDGCFQYLDTKGHMVRGCTSDSSYYGCKDFGQDTCEVCNENACNSKSLAKVEYLQCHFCNSNVDQSCGWAQTKTESCMPKTGNSTFAACFSYQLPNKTIIRGCMSDEDACDPTDLTCELCSKDGCNGQNIIYQECIQCSGKIGEGMCAQNAAQLEASQCSEAVQYYQDRGCYAKRVNDVVMRGCLSELNTDAQLLCDRDEYCKICRDQGCNFQNLVNSAKRLTALTALPIIALIISNNLV
ncbi:unnamed protein product [Hermetia illucens]|uniref:DUF753 domain-containing protein n=2 Tax=Hermetia illucens TaxID=343691 RepID=A0A7R8UFK5_HERIL|nr:unnamed protein product [Hermetia illucens]